MNEGTFTVLLFERNGTPKQTIYTDFRWHPDAGLTKEKEKTAFRFKWDLMTFSAGDKPLITYTAEDQYMNIDVRKMQLHEFKNYMLGSFFKYNREFVKHFPNDPLSSFVNNISEADIIKAWENLIS